MVDDETILTLLADLRDAHRRIGGSTLVLLVRAYSAVHALAIKVNSQAQALKDAQTAIIALEADLEAARLSSIEGWNPGIDMEEVEASRLRNLGSACGGPCCT